MIVVLPEPLDPAITVILPAGIVAERFFSAGLSAPGYWKVRLWISIPDVRGDGISAGSEDIFIFGSSLDVFKFFHIILSGNYHSKT